jgi:hypothetical protein
MEVVAHIKAIHSPADKGDVEMFYSYHLSSTLKIFRRAVSSSLALLCLLIFAAGVQAQDFSLHGARSSESSSARKQELSMQARAVSGRASLGKLYNYLKPEPLQSGPIAEITSPVNGSTFTSWTMTFTWSQPFAPYGSIQFFLDLSSSPGSRDIFARFVGGGGTQVFGIPTDGRTIYVRMWTWLDGVWYHNDYTYTAANYQTAITSPANGSTFNSSNVTFNWGPYISTVPYYLDLSSSPGSRDIFANYVATGSTTVSGIPTDGRTIYVRMWSYVNTGWVFNEYVYQAASSGAAWLLSPANNSNLAATTTFTWNPVAGAQQYFLDLSSSPGSRDIFADYVTGNSATISGIPADGRIIYVRMWTNLGGAWLSNDYVFQGCTGCPPINKDIAQMRAPASGTTFDSSTVNFRWTPVAEAQQYFLDLSSSPGSRDIFANYVGLDSALVTGIPVDGRTIYVRLWTNINGVWLYNSYSYTAKH